MFVLLKEPFIVEADQQQIKQGFKCPERFVEVSHDKRFSFFTGEAIRVLSLTYKWNYVLKFDVWVRQASKRWVELELFYEGDFVELIGAWLSKVDTS